MASAGNPGLVSDNPASFQWQSCTDTFKEIFLTIVAPLASCLYLLEFPVKDVCERMLIVSLQL